MKTVLLIFGTRPEAVKMCPLARELQGRAGVRTLVCVTGQHRRMLDPVLRAFDVTPDFSLTMPEREPEDLAGLTAELLKAVGAVLERTKPDLALVQGDTATTFAGALACFYARVPVGHVEAGLRTYDMDRPWPEELHRRAVTLMSRWHFAPTEQARQNLLRERVSPDRVFVTGNTVIDALRTTVQNNYVNPILDWAADSRLVLVTAHRRENLGAPMERMLRAVRRAVEERPDVKAVYPVHMNPAVRRTAQAVLGGCERIRLTEPMDLADFHNVMARSYLIVTDSGGVQEEAPSLGRPVLVLRDVTERPEGVDAGTLKIVGTDEERVYRELARLLDDPAAYAAMTGVSNPYGNGGASRRIADILLERL